MPTCPLLAGGARRCSVGEAEAGSSYRFWIMHVQNAANTTADVQHGETFGMGHRQGFTGWGVKKAWTVTVSPTESTESLGERP